VPWLLSVLLDVTALDAADDRAALTASGDAQQENQQLTFAQLIQDTRSRGSYKRRRSLAAILEIQRIL
jgi:hypothetical protein